MSVNEEITDLDENIDFHEQEENSEEYTMQATFDNKKLEKIKNLETSLHYHD